MMTAQNKKAESVSFGAALVDNVVGAPTEKEVRPWKSPRRLRARATAIEGDTE